MERIDVVITWVDGADPAWQAEKERYHAAPNEDGAQIRFRNWNFLRYWFRGIETYAPWTGTIHLITCGHLPAWLNLDNARLHHVRHEDFMSSDALPTFNSNAIEIGMHRIKGLSEQFIYFNDDMFLLCPTVQEDFFRGGLPCDDAILSPVMPVWGENISCTTLNNMFVINRYFDKREVIRARPGQWFNLRYGKGLLRSLCLMPWRHFPGFFNDHLPQAFLKSTFDAVWQAEPELLKEVTHHRFRDYHGDVSQWLMRYWQLCSGKFVPVSPSRGKDLELADPKTADAIRSGRWSMVCMNDSEDIADFKTVQKRIATAFEARLPRKSSFER